MAGSGARIIVMGKDARPEAAAFSFYGGKMSKRFDAWLAGMNALAWCVLFLGYGLAAFTAGLML